MKRYPFIFLILSQFALIAQDIPLQRPEEQKATQRQSQALFDVIQPVARNASASALWVWADGRQVAMATAIDDGSKALTKWSEIAFARGELKVTRHGHPPAMATILGVYEDEDVALLKLEGQTFTPIKWNENPDDRRISTGSFLIAPSPEDTPLGFGVASVPARSLRESDLAYIGIVLDRRHEGAGVRVREIDPDANSAQAGVQPNDIILRVDERNVSSTLELRNALLDYQPGDTIQLELMRDDESLTLDVELGRRPQFQGVPEGRLRLMRRMGGPISLRGDHFPLALQTDMQLPPNEIGGPVVNLDGQAIGITISRTDRTRSFILPASHIREMLERQPTDQSLTNLPNNGRRQAASRRGARNAPRAVPMDPATADHMRQHLEDMAKLLERMDREMERLERDQ